jgi:hypothetical protein
MRVIFKHVVTDEIWLCFGTNITNQNNRNQYGTQLLQQIVQAHKCMENLQVKLVHTEKWSQQIVIVVSQNQHV